MAQWINDGLHESAGVIHSFLLAGQSNMAGRGDLTPDTALTAPGCLMLRMGRWQPMSEPVNADRAVLEGACPRSGASLAASFAARYAAESVCQAGLIPCADGGTTIEQWQPRTRRAPIAISSTTGWQTAPCVSKSESRTPSTLCLTSLLYDTIPPTK